MKKIEAIINRKNYPAIREKLDALGIDIIDKRNLEDSRFTSQSKGSRVGGSVVRSTMLAKIELAMSDKVAREVIDIISKNSGLPKSIKSKIFVFEMQETIDLNTLKGESEVESELDSENEIPVTPKFITKRNRLVPLQKRTLYNLEQYYDKHHEVLESDYRIRSFSDFVNYCIMKYLPTLDKQLKNQTIVYEDIF
ncbi:MAG TPA: transcriptional regulator [Nitrosopumilus sp.]|nr:MAG: transcriptional regulator [Nitrosopumilus sp. BACL13 MAG-121220-bin23]MDC4229137.1 transcriptional regulator [Nitrosopumilus sp.]MDC4229723.1 transcriptional regulator [Nitrosopumilus sp.]HII05201.1 transcriptional regulator [Nitrosopumilus sp.]